MERPVVGIMAQHNCIVPAIYGGAVENLLTMLIEENEKKRLLNLIIYSTYDKKAAICASKYKFTKFVFIHSNFVRKAFYKFLRVFNKQPCNSTGIANDFVYQTR